MDKEELQTIIAAKDKVLASFEPDMFQMLKYENALMNPPFKGGNK